MGTPPKRTSKSALDDGKIRDIAQKIGRAWTIWISALLVIGMKTMSIDAVGCAVDTIGCAIDTIDLGGGAVYNWNHLAFVSSRKGLWVCMRTSALRRHFVVVDGEE
jgi:hypothetical protein